jgi:hypothetical protein
MAVDWFPTGNSHTPVAYNSNWLVLDVGSGHNPHPRANVLLDKFLLDNDKTVGRSGRGVVLPDRKFFVVADACAMPFEDGTFDFSIASHIAEHIEHINDFCSELNRVSRGGYLETPSKFAEILRHPPYHIWYVTNKGNMLYFEPTPQDGYPAGWVGKLFFSIYFYQSLQLQGKDVFQFAFGISKPWHYLFRGLRIILVRLWRRFKPLTYTRLLWFESFAWQVKRQ